MAATDSLLNVALARDPSRPLVTYYDDATGERVELSATTLDNWVAKTANLLVDEVGLQPGERVALLLPVHWQTAAILFAAWTAGAVVCLDPAGARVAFVTAQTAAAAGPAEDVYALSLAPLGQGFDPAPPPGAQDFAAEVRGHGDRFTPPAPVPADAPALDDGEAVLTGAELMDLVRAGAAELGLRPGERTLAVGPWTRPVDWVDGLLTPLAAPGSVVLCAHPDGQRLPARAEAEQVTATLGVEIPGIRAL